MIVARRAMPLSELPTIKIAVPGTMTTAFLTLKLLYASLGAVDRLQYEVIPFDAIIPAIESGKFDAGLIIHEGQLTYQNNGLNLICDLGVWWMERTGLPLPLGGNVVRKDLGTETMREVSRLIRASIQYALDHRDEALQYALKYARDMDVTLADRFVGMYVNHWTLDYGDRGRAAIRKLLDEGHRAGIIPTPTAVEFVE
jgi:1,4-dihydroxy-6-naphthoate synthase